MAEPNTPEHQLTSEEKDIKQLKDSAAITEQAVTGKPSRVLRGTKKPSKPQMVSAVGASLHEIAQYMANNKGATLKQTLAKGREEKKKENREKFGYGGEFKYTALNKIFGKNIGTAIGNMFDTKEGKQRKKDERELADLGRKFEFGNKFKQRAFTKIFGQRIGDALSRRTTFGKQATLDRYNQLANIRGYDEEPVIRAQRARAPNVAPIPTAERNPNYEGAHKGLMALGYKKSEATERLKNAPAGASEEDLVRHGLGQSISARQVSKPQAQQQIKQLESKTDDPALAAAEKAQEAADADRKDRQAHQKKVEDDLEEIKKRLHGKGGMIEAILGGLAAAFLAIKNWFKNSILGKIISAITQGIGSLASLIGRGATAAGGLAARGLGALNRATDFAKLGKYGKYAKGLAIADAGIRVASGIADIAQGNEATMPEGFDTLDPLAWAMYGGRKIGETINKGTAALSGGMDLSERISRIGEKPVPGLQPDTRARGIIQRGPTAVAAKPAPVVPATVAAKSEQQEDQVADKADDDKDDLIDAITAGAMATQDVVLDTAKANRTIIPPPTDSGDPSIVVKVRNDESSAAGFISDMFNHPATYGTGGM